MPLRFRFFGLLGWAVLGLLAPAAVGSQALAAEADYRFATRRVGTIEVSRGPDFDAAADRSRKTLHLVWRDGATVKHSLSRDGGASWSDAQVVVATGAAGGVRLASNSTDQMHLAFGVTKEKSAHRLDGRIFHTMFSAGAWSEPQEALLPAARAEPSQVCAARIAVDGRDNVHIIGWHLVSGERWQLLSRAAYARKPAGSASFEPTLEFSYGRDGEGGALHGDIVTDPKGDVHLFYASVNRNAPVLHHATTHLVRSQDGPWSPKVDLFRLVATDMGLRAAIGDDGVIHVVGEDSSKWSRHKNPNAPIDWTYYNNRENPAELKPVHQIPDDWEYGAELLLTPKGDIWISRGNWQQSGPFPWLGRYARREAASGRWLPPQNVSADGHKNADRKYGQVPKFVWFGEKTHLFYAEQKPGEPFKLYQRIFD